MIFKDIAEYEETDSQLSKDTVLRLHKEIERLNNIINEVRELCDYESTNVESLISDILEILDKTN